MNRAGSVRVWHAESTLSVWTLSKVFWADTFIFDQFKKNDIEGEC